jgi:O-antigen/teichoic acid export membrane protein
MGIVQKQAIKGTIINYIGVAVGFLTGALLQPLILSTEEIGVISLLNRYALILAQIFSLGFPSLSLRIFPALRDVSKKHNGYLFLGAIYLAVGFGAALLFYFLGYNWLIVSNQEKSELFSQFVHLLPWLIFFNLLFSLCDTYIRMRFNAIIGATAKEVVQRVLILSALLLLWYNAVQYTEFVYLYAIALSIPGLIMLVYALRTPEFSIRSDWSFLQKFSLKNIANISLFGLLSSTTTILVVEVDTLMVNYFTGLSLLGVYATMFNFGILVSVPSRALKRISSTMISDAWGKQDLKSISTIYYESCINQFVIGGLLFLGIWLNIDSVLMVLGDDYAPGKWVVFFIGLGYLFDMLSGDNTSILITSHLYRYNTYLTLLLVALLIVSNLLFIPVYGITGAAFSSAGSMLVVNLLRFLVLKVKFDFQPFNSRFLVVVLIFGITYLAVNYIPLYGNPYLNVLLRGSAIVIIYGGSILLFRVSPLLNKLLKDLRSRK